MTSSSAVKSLSWPSNSLELTKLEEQDNCLFVRGSFQAKAYFRIKTERVPVVSSFQLQRSPATGLVLLKTRFLHKNKALRRQRPGADISLVQVHLFQLLKTKDSNQVISLLRPARKPYAHCSIPCEVEYGGLLFSCLVSLTKPRCIGYNDVPCSVLLCFN